MTATQTQPESVLAIATEDDILTTIPSGDLVAALDFLTSTIRSFGTEDVAEYLRHLEGRGDVTDDDVTALGQRLTAVVETLQA